MPKVEHLRINRTVITLKEDEVIKNFKECYQGILMEADREDMEQLSKSYWEDCMLVSKQKYDTLFRNGMSMMLLGDQFGQTVDRYFIDKKKPKHYDTGDMELFVVIDCGDHCITIKEEDVQY